MVLSRIASLVVAVGFLIAAILIARQGEMLIYCALAIAFPLPFIWFPEALGNYIGPADMGYINRTTPAVFVAIGGWLLLLILPTVLLLVARQAPLP
ncbi:MAG: hypothetical protein L0241_23530 [Planctomycetia bacterium]|nr:hypothetical protein [Planctomycetia bacterium]